MKQRPMSLKEFMQAEMRQRRIGVNEFAKLCKVAHSTVSKHMSEHPPTPDPRFLKALSQGTNTNLLTVFFIGYPELAKEGHINPDITYLADLIVSLPEESRRIVVAIIQSLQETSQNDKIPNVTKLR